MIISIILSVVIIVLLFKREQRKLRKSKEKKLRKAYTRADSKWVKTQIRYLRRSKYKEKNKKCNLRKVKK